MTSAPSSASAPQEDDLVWYASYGSNLLRERFMCYLRGGKTRGMAQAPAPPCAEDAREPRREMMGILQNGRIRFAMRTKTWNGAVAFLDTDLEMNKELVTEASSCASISNSGETILKTRFGDLIVDPVRSGLIGVHLRMYLISRAQFEHVTTYENGCSLFQLRDDILERVRKHGAHTVMPTMYGRLCCIGEIEGVPVLSFTSPRESNHDDLVPRLPQSAYLQVMAEGLMQMGLSAHSALSYLQQIPGVHEQMVVHRLVTPETLHSLFPAELKLRQGIGQMSPVIAVHSCHGARHQHTLARALDADVALVSAPFANRRRALRIVFDALKQSQGVARTMIHALIGHDAATVTEVRRAIKLFEQRSLRSSEGASLVYISVFVAPPAAIAAASAAGAAGTNSNDEFIASFLECSRSVFASGARVQTFIFFTGLPWGSPLALAIERKLQKEVAIDAARDIAVLHGPLHTSVPAGLGVVDDFFEHAHISNTESVRSVFVYGTLRIDDPVAAPWRAGFLKGTTSRRASIKGAILVFDEYPVAILDDSTAELQGFVVTCNNPSDWERKLAEGDSVEGFPRDYSRALVLAELSGEHDNSSPVQCWIYHRVDSPAEALRIESGDWSAWNAARATHAGAQAE